MAIRFPGESPTILHPPTHRDLDFPGEVKILTPYSRSGVDEARVDTHHRAPGDSRPNRPASPFPFLHLPIELQQAVAAQLQADPATLASVRAIEGLRVANREVRAIIEGDAGTQFKHSINRKLINAVNGLPAVDPSLCSVAVLQLVKPAKRQEALKRAFLIQTHEEPLQALTDWAARLPALSEAERHALVSFATGPQDPDLEEQTADLIGHMGTGLHVLNPGQHQALVNTILRLGGDGRSLAILHFGEGLKALDPPLRNELVQATLAMEDADWSSQAICGLAKGMDALTAPQCTALAKAALSIQNQTFLADAITAIGPHLGLLQPEERALVISKAFSLNNPNEQQACINAITQGLANVDHRAFPEVLAQLRSNVSTLPEQARANFIHWCGTGLAPLEKGSAGHGLYQALFEDALAIGDVAHKSHAIAGLANGLPALSTYGRGQLVSATLTVGNEEDKCDALAALLKNHASLTDDQQSDVFEALLALSDTHRSIAIRSLGSSAGFLTPAQREQLVASTLALDDELEKSWAIAGLGKASTHLTDSQKDQLIDATANMADDESKASAIEGLASMGGARRVRVIDCALTLSTAHQINAFNALAEHMA